MVQCILILVVFAAAVALIMAKKLPTLVALPLLAIVICVIAGIPAVGKDDKGAEIGWIAKVVEAGSIRMASAMLALVFGAWLGQMMRISGVTENIIKKSAELGGDKPLVVTLMMVAVVALLFTTLSGLGSVIMVGTITLPILMSVGIPALTAAAVYLMSYGIGFTFNVTELTTFSNIFSLDLPTIRGFSIYMFAGTVIAILVLIFMEFRKHGVRYSFAAPASPGEGADDQVPLKGLRGALAMLTPLLVLVASAVIGLPPVPSFTIGIVWIMLFTSRGFAHSMSNVVRACYECFKDVAPAFALFIGLGIMVTAVGHPAVKAILQPVLLKVFPTSPLTFVLFFSLLAPLCLYRGPLNLFGMGTGIAAMIVGLGTLSPLAIMGGFLAVARIQNMTDSTNSHNMWVSNFCGVDVNAILRKILPYSWAIAIAGSIVAAIKYF